MYVRLKIHKYNQGKNLLAFHNFKSNNLRSSEEEEKSNAHNLHSHKIAFNGIYFLIEFFSIGKNL